jgi:hypothetical protein
VPRHGRSISAVCAPFLVSQQFAKLPAVNTRAAAPAAEEMIGLALNWPECGGRCSANQRLRPEARIWQPSSRAAMPRRLLGGLHFSAAQGARTNARRDAGARACSIARELEYSGNLICLPGVALSDVLGLQNNAGLAGEGLRSCFFAVWPSRKGADPRESPQNRQRASSRVIRCFSRRAPWAYALPCGQPIPAGRRSASWRQVVPGSCQGWTKSSTGPRNADLRAVDFNNRHWLCALPSLECVQLRGRYR